MCKWRVPILLLFTSPNAKLTLRLSLRMAAHLTSICGLVLHQNVYFYWEKEAMWFEKNIAEDLSGEDERCGCALNKCTEREQVLCKICALCTECNFNIHPVNTNKGIMVISRNLQKFLPTEFTAVISIHKLCLESWSLIKIRLGTIELILDQPHLLAVRRLKNKSLREAWSFTVVSALRTEHESVSENQIMDTCHFTE